MVLKDNSKYSVTTDNLNDVLLLQNIANRNISELADEYDNSILIYPYSFKECEDRLGKQQLILLQATWNGNKCTKVNLETGNVVGFIGINGLSVSIHSRFSRNTDEDFFLHYMLQKVLNINVVSLQHGIKDEQVFDFLLYLFPKLLNDALTQGIYKEYQRNEYNDANVRGVIDINRHMKRNMPFNGRIAYRTRKFSHDNNVTELIRHTIEYICTTKLGRELMEINAETRSNVAQILAATTRYNRQDREKVIKNNQKIANHPFYTRYAPLQKLCLRILRHEKIKYGQNENKIHGILFDVSYLWEEYLATILTRQGFKHPDNRKGIGRINLTNTNKFPRYLDFYREHDSIIIDAKYKPETEKRDDIHQIITYMYRLKGKYGILIHPTCQEHTIKRYPLLGYGEKNDAELHTYLFKIPQDANDYKDFITKIQLSEEVLIKHYE